MIIIQKRKTLVLFSVILLSFSLFFPQRASSEILPIMDAGFLSTNAFTVSVFTPSAGLVPCGRLVNQPPLPGEPDLIDESAPCDLCSAMYMLKQMLNFAVEIAVGIAVFIIILGGFLYAFSAGNPANVEKAKSAITNSIIGLVIMFSAWLIVASILNAMGYGDIKTWNQVSCALRAK